MMPNRHTSPQSSRFQRWLKPFMQGVFRSLWWFSGRRRRATARAGFVFPTTLLLILMVLLTASALTFRTFSRSSQVISQREQQVIYNAATPAIDRAKAKLEFLFTQDPRLIGVPSSDYLANMMLPDADRIPDTVGEDLDLLDSLPDPYTLPGEKRLNINGTDSDGVARLDNAWAFAADVNGDGEIEEDANGEPTEWAAYSILVDHEATNPETGNEVNLQAKADDEKAGALVTRTGPLATTQAIGSCGGAAVVEEGWQSVDTVASSDIQKNFQITAFVSNNRGNNVGQTFESLEFQQSRIASTVNKWGAWFRYDLDIFPGEDFKWNGAMHTDGSLIVADQIDSYMVTSHNSCIYSELASEITLGAVEYDDGSTFEGQAIKGRTKENDYGGANVEFHLFAGDRTPPTAGRNLTNANDSVDGGSPSEVAMNPIALFLRDRSEHINQAGWNRDADWEGSDMAARIRNAPEDRPFVDDFYRADNRWGPKPRYDLSKPRLSLDNNTTAVTTDDRTVGQEIDNGDGDEDYEETQLIADETGLDGYWERQAIKGGLRVVVGERLELGNVNGWGQLPAVPPVGAGSLNAIPAPPGDPLYPPTQSKTDLTTFTADEVGNHEYRQRRTLRDNLAAVQGMVVYHYEGPGDMASDGTFPAACMALTAHPGTQQSIINSRTFDNYDNLGTLKTDFFRGEGTNGWEFKYHPDFDTPSEFSDEVIGTAPLGKALRNLAYFAGDPRGGAPSFPPVQDAFVHPYPFQSMWGDFSALRRIIDDGGLASAASFIALSPADKSTVHSAACTLGLLAYNVDRDIAEIETILANPPSSMQNVSGQLGQSIGQIATCLNGSDPNNTGGGGNPCGGTGSFGLVNFLKARGDLNASGSTIWVDQDTDTVITDGNLCPANGGNADKNGFQAKCDTAEYFAEWTLDDWLALVEEPGVIPSLAAGDVDAILNFSSQVNYYTSLIRDRDLGFREGQGPNSVAYDPGAGSFVNYDYSTGLTEPVGGFLNGNNDLVFKVGCDPNIFQALAAGGGGGADNNVAAGLIACSEIDEYPIKFPSLYYLFPLVDHDHDGADYHQQPTAEEYVNDPYITRTDVNGAGSGVNYAVVRSAATDDPIKGLADIAAVPRAANPADAGNGWVLPAAANASGLTAPNNAGQVFRIQVPAGTGIDVPFLDKGIFNGREQMAVRVLDIDIEAITQNQVGTGDYWLPSKPDNPAIDTDFATEGIFYAFREDAVREDEIVRPAGAGTNCADLDGTNFRVVTQAGCRMNAMPGLEQDPPLQDNNVSIKPVDFAPDPDRRPHGFRFRTASGAAADFSGGDPATGRQNGMTFVSDNTAYIQGDFNLHSSDGTTANLLEEFTDTLDGVYNFAEFYTNRTADELDLDNFANLTNDHWRPVEILTDGLTVLSADFPDGAISDAFLLANSRTSSFASFNRPLRETAKWLNQVPGDNTTPIWIDRNGTYYLDNSAGAGIGKWQRYFQAFAADNAYISMGEENERNANQPQAVDTYVNATFVGSIVPERTNESYGGLHNYPRFLERWSDRDLFISGAFIQLNFSTSATGPYDQQAWEPGTAPTTAEWFYHYQPPDRRWGFDVGLLYVPPAPAARRFAQLGRSRSEYYRELSADDPYISNLRCAVDEDGDAIFPDFCN
ncbi:hormogonium polysaccharide biosynthesis protein HpsA [Halomicronema sp. CCY15110]|uniref:hormogonium polysaccharide biosynthesis protein HpsA n=1 Tax=Halomicronema sp. CCY15110 TaxID=2767773 RepID=UPI0028168C79|nr:hormogonium polysaccharide biosynthesis protein HpsA [Halomicronema sp. CCY15110]